jgi:cytidylate kinase
VTTAFLAALVSSAYERPTPSDPGACRRQDHVRANGREQYVIVAIDGPAGAGKSTVARRLAERLSFPYLDTGAMYRALTWLALELGVPLDDPAALAALAAEHPVGFETDRVTVGGHDVTVAIRGIRIDRAVSTVARHADVRAVMREHQRRLALAGDAVVEGRDIGTVVCPDAEVKIYLVADPAVRAQRRRNERPGADEQLAEDLRFRDEQDADQMRPASDAHTIDATDLTAEQVVDQIAALVEARRAA